MPNGVSLNIGIGTSPLFQELLRQRLQEAAELERRRQMAEAVNQQALALGLLPLKTRTLPPPEAAINLPPLPKEFISLGILPRTVIPEPLPEGFIGPPAPIPIPPQEVFAQPIVRPEMGEEILRTHSQALLKEQMRQAGLGESQSLPSVEQQLFGLLTPEERREAALKKFLPEPKLPSLGVDVEAQLRTMGKTSETATPEDVSKAINLVEIQRAQSLAQAMEIRAKAQANVPLGRNAPLWINDKGQTAKPTMTISQAEAAGFRPLSQQARNAAASAQAALAQLSEYKRLAQKLLPHRTGNILRDIAAIQANRVRLALLRAAGDPDAQDFEGLFGRITAIARALGDAANIAIIERLFLRQSLATTGDTVESAMAKLNTTERILKKIIESKGLPVGPVLTDEEISAFGLPSRSEIPEGTIEIGQTATGQPVLQLPDGSTMVWEP